MEEKEDMNTQFILPDFAYAKGVIPTWNELQKNRQATIDWLPPEQIMQKGYNTAKTDDQRMTFTDDVGNPFYTTPQGDIVKPGMMPAAEGSAFLAERTYKSTFHQKCSYERVTSKKNTVVFMDADSKLQSLTALEDGKQIKNLNERTPGRKKTRKKVVTAEPYIEFTEFTWTFMEDNLIGGRFLQEYVDAINRKRDFNQGQIELYAIRDEDADDTDALHVNDGLFKQLDKAYNYYSQNVEDVDSQLYGQGYYCGIHGTGTDKVPIDFSKVNKEDNYNVVDQLCDMETQYNTQEGMEGYEFLVGYEAYGQLRRLARKRETSMGDELYFLGRDLVLNGVPITPCHELGRPLNGYKQHILLGNFNNAFTNYMREDYQTHIEWNQDRQRWVLDTKIYFGSLLKFEQDILAAEVINLPTQLAANNNNSNGSSNNPIDDLDDDIDDTFP